MQGSRILAADFCGLGNIAIRCDRETLKEYIRGELGDDFEWFFTEIVMKQEKQKGYTLCNPLILK